MTTKWIGIRVLVTPPGCSSLARLQAPLVRWQDAQLLAILGDRAPRDREPSGLQLLRHFLVGERPPGVLGGEEVLDLLLDRHRRHHLAVRRLDAAVEEV